MMRLLLLTATLLILAPWSAWAEVCTFSTSGDWTSATAFSGTDDCTLSADDDIVIADGAVVTITSGSTVSQDGTTASTGVTVQSGGSLVMEENSQLNLNEDGLDCQPGSTCTFVGKYREFGSATPALLDDRSNTSYFTLGDLIPCAGTDGTVTEPDCNAALGTPGDSTAITVQWVDEKHAVADGQSGDTNFAESIGEITADDVMCFFDPVPGGWAPVDVDFCYEIDSVSVASSPYEIVVDVEQGTLDSNGFPLARRQIVQSTLTAAVSKGQRTACIDSTTASAAALDETHVLSGRWLRFADQSLETTCDGDTGTDGTECGIGSRFRIARTVEDTDDSTCSAGSDLIHLGDLNGADQDYASGQPVWIDYGWQSGDPIYFMSPARLGSSTTTVRGDSLVRLDGTVSVQAVVADQTGGWDVGTDGSVFIETFKDVWLVDISSAEGIVQSQRQIQFTDVSNSTIEHLTGTGGNNKSDCGTGAQNCRTHTIGYNGLFSNNTFLDTAFRHHQDDMWVNDTTDAGSSGNVILRARSQWRSDSTDSMQIVDNSSGADNKTWARIEDIECVDCTDGQTTGGNPFQNVDGTTVRGLTLWGYRGNATGGQYKVDGLLSVGALPDGVGGIAPANANHFEIRDAQGASGTFLSASPVLLKNGYFYNVQWSTGTTSGIVIKQEDGTTLDNIAFIDVYGGSSTGSMIDVLDTASPLDVLLQRLTFTQTQLYPGGADAYENVVFLRNDLDGANTTLTGLLFAHLDVGDNWGIRAGGTAIGNITLGVNCFFDNAQTDGTNGDFFDNHLANLPAGTIRDIDPLLVSRDTRTLRVDAAPGSIAAINECGIRSSPQPGNRSPLSGHYLSGVEPISVGPQSAGGGGGGGSFAPTPFGRQ